MKRAAATFVALAIASGVAACGNDGGRLDLRDPGVDDFAYKPHRVDQGSLPERMAVLRTFRSVQRDFYDGDVDSFCASFNRRSALTFDQRRPFRLEVCQEEVKRAMEAVDAGNAKWPAYRLHWVRIYDDLSGYDSVGGVTLRGPKGDLPRMGFVKVAGKWLADFDIPTMLKGLNTRMAPRGKSASR